MSRFAWTPRPARPASISLAFVVALMLGGCGRQGESSPGTGTSQAAGAGSHTTDAPAASSADAGRSGSAREILAAAIEAYQQAATYSDQGTVHLEMQFEDRKYDQTFPFAVTLARPNRVRMEAYKTTIACDGSLLRAVVEGVANQMLQREAPQQLNIRTLYVDPFLNQVVNGELAGGPPQLGLLLEQRPLEILLHQASEPQIGQPGTIGGRSYDRIVVNRPEGNGVFWIDPQTRVVRRFEYPVEEMRKQMFSNGKAECLSITAEFTGATLNGPIPPERFQLELPPGARVVKFLVPPEPDQLLGKKVPDFWFADLEGHALLPENLAGKIVVLDFWSVHCEPCKTSFPALEAVYRKYKDNPKLAFYAVSVDPAATTPDALRQAQAQFGSSVPILRDTEGELQRAFMVYGIPALFLIGADGLVQDFEVGVNPDLEKQLPDKIEQLALGRPLYEEGQRAYQQRLKNIEQAVEHGGDPAVVQPPRAEAEPASPPGQFKLTSLWRAEGLKAPGNLLVVSDAAGVKIFVVDEWRQVVELDAQGKTVAGHAPDMPREEVLCHLRSTVGPDGQRYFLGWTPFQQQVHVFDHEWKSILHFPADALEQRPPSVPTGITDALFVPGKSRPELIVGYWGPAGVQRASLEGERLWANRSLENVFRMVLSGPEKEGPPLLMCLNGRGTVVSLSLDGERQAEVPAGTRGMPLQTLVAADLDGDGQPEYCGLAQRELGLFVIVGLGADGKPRWTYDLPKGQPDFPIEQITSGAVLGGGSRQWIVAAADGSVHVLSAEGKPLDRFSYGSKLTGLAVTQIEGQTVLILASPQGVEALQVQPGTPNLSAKML